MGQASPRRWPAADASMPVIGSALPGLPPQPCAQPNIARSNFRILPSLTGSGSTGSRS
jgi:hypothetical protein